MRERIIFTPRRANLHQSCALGERAGALSGEQMPILTQPQRSSTMGSR